MLEEYIEGDGMTGQGHGGHGHAAHGGHEEEDSEAEPRKPYEISDEAQKLYKTIIKENFKPRLHKQTIKKHDKAHKKALETLFDKIEKLEEEQHEYIDEFNVKEALAHALITYRKEANIPVSEDKEDFHNVYQAIDTVIENIRKEGKIDVDKMINEGRYGELFQLVHQRELGRIVTARVKYGIDKHLPHGKDHTFYQGLVKAHLNEVGEEWSEGDIAKVGRDDLVGMLMQHYDKKMPKVLEKYAGKKAKEYHAKHGHETHGHENHEAAAHH